MITILKNSSAVNTLCSISKLIKSDEESHPSRLEIDDVRQTVTFTLYGNSRLSCNFVLDKTCVILSNVKKKEISFNNSQFFQILSSNSNKDINVDIDNGFSVKVGRKLMKLISIDMAPPAQEPIIDIGIINTNEIKDIVSASVPISNKNSICIFDGSQVMTVDGVSRRALFTYSLGTAIPSNYATSFVDATGASKTSNIPVNLGLHFKDLTVVSKMLAIFDKQAWGTKAKLIAKCPQFSNISSIGYEMGDPINGDIKAQIFHGLLNDSIYQREIKTIAQINKFKTTHTVSMDAEELRNSINDAFYTSEESNIRISNKNNKDTIDIQSHDGSYSDEIKATSCNCIFDISIKSDILKTIISSHDNKSIFFEFNKNMPALSVSSSNAGTYFISCLSNPAVNIMFEVKDIKVIDPAVTENETQKEAITK